MNEAVFLKINSFAGTYQWLDRLGIFLAVYFGYVLVAFLLFFVFYKSSPKKRLMFLIAFFSAIISRLVITEIIRALYHRPRPFQVMQVRQLIPESGWSLPSGHAAFFFAVFTAIWLYNRRLGWVFFIASLIMGIARVFSGVHWPLDIFWGAVVGITTALALNFITRKYIGKIEEVS